MNSITDLFLDFRNYVADNFGADPDAADLNWNCIGASIHYFDDTRTIQFRLWERSEDYRGIPDMAVIAININFRGEASTIHEEMQAFSQWLVAQARLHGFRCIADENRPPLDNEKQVPGCTIACIRL